MNPLGHRIQEAIEHFRARLAMRIYPDYFADMNALERELSWSENQRRHLVNETRNLRSIIGQLRAENAKARRADRASELEPREASKGTAPGDQLRRPAMLCRTSSPTNRETE